MCGDELYAAAPSSLARRARECEFSVRAKKPGTAVPGWMLLPMKRREAGVYLDSSDQRSMMVSAPGVRLRTFVAIMAFSEAVAFFSRLAILSSFSRRCRRRLISLPRSLIPPTVVLLVKC